MPTWPSTPEPHFVTQEEIKDEVISVQFDGGYEVRRPRWHRHKKEFVLTYQGLVSNTLTVNSIANFAGPRDFIVARRLEWESFTFQHPYYTNSVYTVRYFGETLPMIRKARTKADSGTDVFEMEVRLREVF